jgi:hypothetical protein
MKVKDLIDILKDIPPDTEIRILKDVSRPMCFESIHRMEELTKEDVNYVELGNFVNLGTQF